MKLDEMFPRRFLNGTDIPRAGTTVTITRIQTEQVNASPGTPPVEKFVLFFAGHQKGLILNRTIANQIRDITGTDDTETWTGKQITLYPVPMQVAGKQRTAIRIRKP